MTPLDPVRSHVWDGSALPDWCTGHHHYDNGQLVVRTPDGDTRPQPGWLIVGWSDGAVTVCSPTVAWRVYGPHGLAGRLTALQAVARGYCPECGRGDAGPTAEHWEQQRQRADEAEAQLRLVDAMRQQNLDAAAATTQRAETAEAAVDRAREAAAHYLHEYEGGEDPCAAAVLAALDQPKESP